MKRFKRSAAVLFCVFMICMLLPMQALAAGVIDLERAVHLTLSYQNESTPLSGAEFELHRVAATDQYGRLMVTDDFSQFNIDIKGKDDEAWRKLAAALEGFVLRDKITPCDSGKTDSTGSLSFPTGDQALAPGLYLVMGDRHTQGGYYYDASPFMVMLPESDHEQNAWAYDVTANVKYDSSKVPGGSGGSSGGGGGSSTLSRKVLKVWEDAGHEDERPKEVIVQLLRDGDVYSTVTLNAENTWRHTWTSLSNRYSWTVAEKELEHYSVGLSREGTTFVLTNTYTEKIPEEPTPTDPGTTTPTDPGTTTPADPGTVTPTDPNPTAPADPDLPDPGAPLGPKPPHIAPFEPKLPQTGQLWWPVPLLVTAGIVCIIFGLLRRRGITDED